MSLQLQSTLFYSTHSGSDILAEIIIGKPLRKYSSRKFEVFLGFLIKISIYIPKWHGSQDGLMLNIKHEICQVNFQERKNNICKKN